MKPNLIVPACALALATGLALASTPGLSSQDTALTPGAESMVLLAANADNPYGNVDHRNDAGNDTGDAKVDQLNSGQLNQNFKGPYDYRATGAGGPTAGRNGSAPAGTPPAQSR